MVWQEYFPPALPKEESVSRDRTAALITQHCKVGFQDQHLHQFEMYMEYIKNVKNVKTTPKKPLFIDEGSKT